MFSQWRKTAKRAAVLGLSAVLVVSGVTTAPSAAKAASGSFDSITIRKISDGYTFVNNPVDTVGDNNIVAVHDYVGFDINTVTTAQAVSDAVITFTKPDCWKWENTVDQSLNFMLGGGQTASAATTYPNPNTVSVTWSQADNGTVTSSPFRVQATSACANDSTWQPVFTVTDASGTKTVTLDTVTVKSLARADLSVAAQGNPTQIGSAWFQGIGNKPAWQQIWAVRLGPETLSSVGYSDPAGDTITFNISFKSNPDPYRLRSRFELPRIESPCWQYVSPSPTNNSTFAPLASNQTVTITMRKRAGAGCGSGMLTQNNAIWITQLFPQEFLNPGDNLPIIATVEPVNWQTAQGEPIIEVVPGNNTATSWVEYKAPNYGYMHGVSHFAPKVPNADYTGAWPWRRADTPVVQGIQAQNWASVSGSFIAYQAEFVTNSFFSFDNPQITDAKAYQFWDKTKQTINLAKINHAVMGYVAPSNSAAATNPAVNTKAFDAASYTVECTTGYAGSATNADVAAMTWAPCATMNESDINGVRFQRPGVYQGVNLPGYTGVKHMFTMVPFKAIGDSGESISTVSKWSANEFADQERVKATAARIVGNILLIGKEADKSSVQPEETINYTVKPNVSGAIGAFLPGAVNNLKVVDTLSAGIDTVDLSGLDPFWQVTKENADLGADSLPYTADDVRGIRLTFTPTVPVQTDTVLPEINYSAKMGIFVPPNTAPHNSIVKNIAVVSADQSNGSPNAIVDIFSGVPQAAFFSKKLLSDPVIEVEDPDAAWRVHWVNYNNDPIGKTQFVDVFPYSGDARGSNFDGTLKIDAIKLGGEAVHPSTVVELTTDSPASIAAAPANNVNWTVVDINNKASWPANATAVRVSVTEVRSQGIGFMDLHFKLDGHKRNNVYVNDASGSVYDDTNLRYVDMGVREGEKVRVIASSIAGIAWVDSNGNGLRDNTEAPLPGVRVILKREGVTGNFREVTTGPDGRYLFDNLHSDNYQVIFDSTSLRNLGYLFTTKMVGSDTTIDSDADQITGETATVALAPDTNITGIDAGGIELGIAAESLTGSGSFTRTYNWSIEKKLTNRDSMTAANGDTNAAYEVITKAETAVDSADTFTGTFTVKNPSAVRTYTYAAAVVMSGTGITCTAENGPSFTINPGQTQQINYTCAGMPGDTLDRTVTLTLQPQGVHPVTGLPYPAVVKTAQVMYQMNEVNKTINVKDQFTASSVTNTKDFGPYTWAANAEFVEAYAAPLVQIPAGDCAVLKNVATITQTGQKAEVTDTTCRPADVTVSKNVLTALGRTYAWKIDKQLLNPDALVDASGKATLDYEVKITEGNKTDATWVMNGEITVTNPNNYKSVEVTVTDVTDIGGGASCQIVGGATVTLAAGETRKLAYECTFTSQPNYNGINTATVTWNSDRAGVDRTEVDAKSATATADIREADWTLTEFQKTVEFSDVLQLNGVAQPSKNFGPYTWTAEGTEHIEKYSVDVQVAAGRCLVAQNTATLKVVGATAVLGQSSANTTLCREAQLGVDAANTASLVRTFAWDIAKTFDNKNDFENTKSEKAPAVFTVLVKEGESTDSAHQFTGAVKITNDNDYRGYTLTLSADTTNPALTCTFNAGNQLVITASSQSEALFTCAGDPGAVLTGDLTVNVAGQGSTPLTVTVPFDYQVAQEINKTVHIADSRVDNLDWEITWSKEGTEHARLFNLEHHLTPGNCGVYDNTATITETKQSAEVSAKRCADAPPALKVTGASLPITLALFGILMLAAAAVITIRQRRQA